MTPLKKTLTAAGLGAAMFAGGVFGVASMDPQPASALQDAQENTEATETETTDSDRGEDKRRGAAFSDELAELLGMTTDEIRDAVRSGSSLADLATENGVEPQEIVDVLVAAFEARLDEMVANGRLTAEEADARKESVIAKIEARVNGEHVDRGHRRHRSDRAARGDRLNAVAELLGLTAEDLRAERREGATIADLAEANGVSVDDVVEVLVAEAAAKVEAAVESGRLDDAEAAEKLAALEERITAAVNGEGDFGHRGHRGRSN